jgi:hypothetical protein
VREFKDSIYQILETATGLEPVLEQIDGWPRENGRENKAEKVCPSNTIPAIAVQRQRREAS